MLGEIRIVSAYIDFVFKRALPGVIEEAVHDLSWMVVSRVTYGKETRVYYGI
ncbi:hypothetical protein ACUHMQ_12160 [Chitinimonas sp. PSY-7]|uniref:hypothetical protein n=1 Tax=Chitinimonas sp. PSY-7 TaxID=3459088 RepID=UPI004040213B